MPDTPRDRTARSRARATGKAQPCPQCPKCGRLVWSQRTLPLCSRCWRRSPEGKAADAERQRRRYAAKRKAEG
jgi:hypothetical protein